MKVRVLKDLRFSPKLDLGLQGMIGFARPGDVFEVPDEMAAGMIAVGELEPVGAADGEKARPAKKSTRA